MTETEPTNWQIRVSVFDTQENAYKITEAIEALNLGYDVRILNIDKGDNEVDDETHIFCKSCGRLDGALHDYVCDACLILEKEKQQQEEDAKYNDDKRGTEWDWVSFCPDCGTPTMYDTDGCYWYCINNDCDNNTRDTTVNAYDFDARKTTYSELMELKKKYPYTGWI